MSNLLFESTSTSTQQGQIGRHGPQRNAGRYTTRGINIPAGYQSRCSIQPAGPKMQRSSCAFPRVAFVSKLNLKQRSKLSFPLCTLYLGCHAVAISGTYSSTVVVHCRHRAGRHFAPRLARVPEPPRRLCGTRVEGTARGPCFRSGGEKYG
jgi:hypothetical protein